jgi:uncharacterized membrane protein
MFELFAVAIAIVALIVARKTFNQVSMLRARLDAIEAAGLAARPAPPPPLDELGQTLAPSQADMPATPAETEPAATLRETEPAAAADAIRVTAVMPPPLPQAEPGFEERVGTRWVVWLGGLTLALGGFFLVPESGPGARKISRPSRLCRSRIFPRS